MPGPNQPNRPQAPKPNRPQTNQREVEALRLRNQHPGAVPTTALPSTPPTTNTAQGQGSGYVHTIGGDMPAGKIWTPGPEDYKPVRKPQTLAVPDFIPLRLSDPVGAEQTAIANSVLPKDRQHPMPVYTESTDTQESVTMTQPPNQNAPDDFDPNVDDPDDVFVGASGLHSAPPVVERTSTGERVAAPTQPPLPQRPAVPGHAFIQPPSAPASGPTPGPGPGSVKQNPLVDQPLPTEHPVLLHLRERFGLIPGPSGTKSEVIGGLKFTFRKYTNQSYSKFVVNEILTQSVETEAEFNSKLGYALVAIGLAAINDVPVHEVFDLELEPALELPLVRQNPLHPPTSVIVGSARYIYQWLLTSGTPELGDTLAAVYGKLYPSENLIPDKGLWKYECPKHNCTEIQERLPRYNAEGEMRPVYCPVHGLKMNALGSLEELSHIPLA
jgi:hypothetical protein